MSIANREEFRGRVLAQKGLQEGQIKSKCLESLGYDAEEKTFYRFQSGLRVFEGDIELRCRQADDEIVLNKEMPPSRSRKG